MRLPDPKPAPDYSPGAPASPNGWMRPPVPNVLASGVLCHYVQPGTGIHIATPICNVDTTRSPVEISVQQVIGGRMTTVCNVKYDDQTFAQGTWHLPSDG